MNPERQFEPDERVVSFTSEDGRRCNLINIRRNQTASRGPVILVHGAGVRSNIFRPPVGTTVVDYLLDHGFDVWLENWRASIDLPPNQWTLDEAAAYDHPVAFRTVVRETGWNKVKAIAHGQGSTSLVMSLVSGLLPQIDCLVTNAVTLHPVVPFQERMSFKLASAVLRLPSSQKDPLWYSDSPSPWARLMRALLKQTARVPGPPNESHGENINSETQLWLSKEFGYISPRYLQQMAASLRRGSLVSVKQLKGLAENLLAQRPETDARIGFLAGEWNRTFLPESQRTTFEYFDSIRPDYHTLHVVPKYGHLDIFVGKNAARDVFPRILRVFDGI